MPPQAEPVGVRLTLPAGGHAVNELGLAAGAVENAGQVMLVAVGAFAGLAVCDQHSLYLGEQLQADESGVLAVELEPTPGDRANVVRVVQNQSQLLGVQRPGSTVG